MSENRKKRRRWIDSGNRGLLTVEASLIIPLILFLAAGIILLVVSQGSREALRSEMYHTLYTLPVAEELDGDPRDGLRDRANILQSHFTHAELGDDSSGDCLVLNGSVPYSGIGSYSGVLAAHAERERDLCSKRLRRWQFYGNIAEE